MICTVDSHFPWSYCVQREEKKREVIDSEISLQRLQMKHKVCEEGYYLVYPLRFFTIFTIWYLSAVIVVSLDNILSYSVSTGK